MSVLQDMTSGIMSTKATKAAKLTPVAGESGMTVADVALTIPKDLPNRYMAGEELTLAAKDLRVKAQQLLDIADAIDVLVGQSSAPRLDPAKVAASAQREVEAAADARVAEANPTLPVIKGIEDEAPAEDFKARMQRLSAEAQASVFTAADDDGLVAIDSQPPKVEGWTCPDHGALDLRELTARNGREYRMCGLGDCEEFEKEPRQ